MELVKRLNWQLLINRTLTDYLTGLPIIQQKKRICTPCNPMIFALTANTDLKLKALRGRKKTGTDHADS
jgi:hypothetical protein